MDGELLKEYEELMDIVPPDRTGSKGDERGAGATAAAAVTAVPAATPVADKTATDAEALKQGGNVFNIPTGPLPTGPIPTGATHTLGTASEAGSVPGTSILYLRMIRVPWGPCTTAANPLGTLP